ncbi:MAG: RNA polymerase subunit sigma-70 [Caulobacterales bacterium 68-7]|nr:MAG: RNA polymerase subunit sigma-70 [Caulobacterales bacterium 68-7]
MSLDVSAKRKIAAPEAVRRLPLADAYLQCRPWLTSLLTRRFGPDEAADIAQDTYLRIHAYAPPSPIENPKALLARIALNLAANRFRKASRESVMAPDAEVLTRQPTPSSQDEAVLFEQMLLALPAKLRDVFVLSHVKGLSYREIAQLRGISVKAVEKRMTQAIARCADLIRA